MDVIGRDDLPTDTKASATTKITNGNATLSEDNGTVANGAGRKKTKRKSKAKNSSREDADSGELKIEAPSARATTVLTLSNAGIPLPKIAASMVLEPPQSPDQANGESVNSNSSAFGDGSRSSSHKSSHSNGLPADDALVDPSIDAISKQLGQCVQMNCNGLTNGLPKHESKSVGQEVGKGAGENNDGRSNSVSVTKSGKESTGKGSKKKHRSSQSKKAQTMETNCTVNGDVEHGEDDMHEEDQKDVQPVRNRQVVSAPMDSATVVEEKQDSQTKNDAVESPMNPSQSCLGAGNGPDGTAALSASTSSTPVPMSPTAGCGDSVDEARSIAAQNQPTPAHITYQVYESERQMPAIMSLIQKDLSEPYSIYTYRYFIHNWPKLCFLAQHGDTCVGAIVCKLDIHRQDTRRGYIAMLAVDKDYRKLKIGTTLVQKAIQVMVEDNADEVVLETEITNQPALRLYENLGFVRDKRLFHYYLNGVDALRLKLWFR